MFSTLNKVPERKSMLEAPTTEAFPSFVVSVAGGIFLVFFKLSEEKNILRTEN